MPAKGPERPPPAGDPTAERDGAGGVLRHREQRGASAKRAEHSYGRAGFGVSDVDNGEYFTGKLGLDWWIWQRRFGEHISVMATAHSPVPDLLFYGAAMALGAGVATLCMFLPQWASALALGALSAAAWCYWAAAWFHKFLGKFDIST